MKKISLLLVSLLSTVAVMAQDSATALNVKLNDESVKTFTLSNINKITFSDLSFVDVYRQYQIEIDPAKAFTPDDANDECLNNAGEKGTDGYGLEGLFDSNADRYFHSCYFNGHHYDETYNSYVDIELPEKISTIAFDICPRAKNLDWWGGTFPKWVKVYVYDDKESEWVFIGEKTGLNDAIDQETKYALVGPFISSSEFSKVRFSVVQGRGKVLAGTLGVNEGYWSCGHLAVYGK